MNRLKKSSAPPNKKDCSFEELSSADSWTMAWKFWFIFQYKTKPSYMKKLSIEVLTGKLTGSF